MTIAAILQTKGNEVLTVNRATPVRDVVELLAEMRIGAIPVWEEEKQEVVGIVSERDVIYRLRSDGAAILDRPVSDIMTAPAITVTPSTDILGALSLMTRRRIRHLPVVDGQALVGIVSIGDLVKFRIDRIEAEAEAMRNYIQSV